MNLPIVSSSQATRAPSARVAILAFDGVDELDLFGVNSILTKAIATETLAAVEILSRSSQVSTSGGTRIVTRTLADGESHYYDAYVLPGGRGALKAAEEGGLSKPVRHAFADGRKIYCCCSGALIAAAALRPMSGRMAIHRKKREDLKRYFKGEVVTGVADDNGIFSIGGQTFDGVKSVTLAFRLLADIDADVPHRIAERTEIAWKPEYATA